MKGNIALIGKSFMLIAAVSLAVPAYPQSHTNEAAKQASPDAARQVKEGDNVPLGRNLTARVTKVAKSPFTTVKTTGEAIVVSIELDSANKSVAFTYKLSPDFNASDIYVVSGTSRFGPKAVVEDFPSWGGDNDKEVEVLSQKETGGGTLDFSGKGSISLLFDIPGAQAKAPKRLSIILRTVKPTDETLSLVVNL